MSKSLEEKILEDIEKTGFIVELEIMSKFLNREWDVTHSSTFEDYDLKISREIDLIAKESVFDFGGKVRVEIHLVIEIKKDSKRPWVILSSNQEGRLNNHLGWNLLSVRSSYLEIISKSGVPTGEFKDKLDSKVLTESDFFSTTKNLGRAFHEAFKGPTDKSKIYESLISVSKASFYEYQKIRKRNNEDYKSGLDSEHQLIDLIIPVVVLEGSLYEVNLTQERKRILNKIDFITTKFNYSSPNYVSEEFNQLELYPLIIESSFVDKFIIKMEDWIKSIKDKVLLEIKTQKNRN